MKIGLLRKSWGFAWVAVIGTSAYLAMTTVCHAETDALEPLTVQVTLATNSTLSVGEPIVLHYKVSNNSTTKQLSFDSGPRHEGWYRLSLTNATGKQITAATPQSSLDEVAPQGLHPASEISLLPGGNTEGDIVATQSFAVTQPGDYVLTLHIPVTYYVEPIGAWYPKGRPADQIPMSFAQDYNFHLKVMPMDQKRLQSDAEMLNRELHNPKFSPQRETLLAALSSLPEAVALPSWQSLVLDPTTPSAVLSSAVELLGGLRSLGAADLLGQIIFDRIPSSSEAGEEGVKASARRAVAEMYNLGDDRIKQKLEQVYAGHGASKSNLMESVTTSNPN
jgi:hypothetical protein